MTPRRVWVVVACGFVLAAELGGCGGKSDPTPTGPAPVPQREFRDDRPGLVEPTPVPDSANRNARGPSVNHNDPPPPISATVEAAAREVGCETRSFASEPEPALHVERDAATTQSIPPLSGAHNKYWARWGVYDVPVPYTFQLHNLEHGGVILHYGTEVPVAGVNALRELWARKPAYVIVVPDSHPQFAPDAVVAGSQQRWVSCKPFKPAQISAIEAFVDDYRGRGPETQPAVNVQNEPRPEGLPAPLLEDPGAR